MATNDNPRGRRNVNEVDTATVVYNDKWIGTQNFRQAEQQLLDVEKSMLESILTYQKYDMECQLHVIRQRLVFSGRSSVVPGDLWQFHDYDLESLRDESLDLSQNLSTTFTSMLRDLKSHHFPCTYTNNVKLNCYISHFLRVAH